MPEHGTVNGYVNARCRCQPCTDAHTTYGRNRRRAIAYGTHQPLTDATDAQLHIKQLRADGMSIPHIAKHAQLPEHVIDTITRGGKARPTNITNILNVKSTPTRGNHHLATGATRRIQGLRLLGWADHHIETAGNLGIGTCQSVIRCQRPTVTDRVHNGLVQAVRVLMARTPPDTKYTRIARSKSAKKGYVPLLMWDDIDDPDAKPWVPAAEDTDQVTVNARRSRVDPDVIDRVWRLHGQGMSDREIAYAVGYATAAAVCKLRARHPRKDTP